MERFRNRVLQVTFSTPGIKAPDGEISDDELIDTLKKVVDERTSLHRKLMDMKDEVKLAESSKAEILDKLAKLKAFLSTSAVRFLIATLIWLLDCLTYSGSSDGNFMYILFKKLENI